MGAAPLAEEHERAHDLGVERLFPHDRSTWLDLAVEAESERIGILAGSVPMIRCFHWRIGR